ncbi:MAG: hypothetical protein HY591_05865 [Candidatus Omnitrophica bacterium]|nr:hypothetical protein [Candidatus Omnitrophota bacterium]
MKQILLPLPRIIVCVFLFSLLYWSYLALNTRMSISCDSIGYEALGRLIQEHGFLPAYFKNNEPNREPLYPLLVSSSMYLERILGMGYTKIMAAYGVLILLMTQILIYIVMRLLNIRTGVCALALAYMGISPALNNTAFSLYSEIATYPFILLLILLNARAYQTIREGTIKDSLRIGFYLGLIFLAVTFIKAVFELVFFILCAAYVCILAASLFQRKNAIALNCLIVLVIFAASYQAPVLAYKSLNKKYNDHFVLTNRGSWALYGSCAVRAEKLTVERFLTAAASVPGRGFCEQTFGKEKCFFWGTEQSDLLGDTKLVEISRHTPASMVDQRMLELAKEKAMKNPAQFILLMGLDGLKMFFWESTQIGFVAYPPWMERMYHITLFKNGLRMLVSLLSLGGFLYLGVFIFKNFTAFLNGRASSPRIITGSFMFLIIAGYVGLHSLFNTVPRWALPLAPLYIITIGIMLDGMVPDRRKPQK